METLKHYTEYKWQEPETCAHEYIVPLITKIIRELKIDLHAKILDAGCGTKENFR
jgi:hypothetical protein